MRALAELARLRRNLTAPLMMFSSIACCLATVFHAAPFLVIGLVLFAVNTATAAARTWGAGVAGHLSPGWITFGITAVVASWFMPTALAALVLAATGTILLAIELVRAYALARP